MTKPLTLLALVAAASFFSSCANDSKSTKDFAPKTIQPETRSSLYSSFKTIGEPYNGLSMIGTSSGWRGTEMILLEGGYLLEYSVHYRGFSVFDEESPKRFKRSEIDLISNLRINPHKGWTSKELDRLYRNPPTPNKSEMATPRKPSDQIGS
jgi:hypothetical protein